MIKVYKVKIGDKVYEVEIEGVMEKEGEIKSEKKEISNSSINPTNEKIEGIEIESPMQGIVVSLPLKEGDNVRTGDTLLILEAMKMENPIVSPKDGTIKKINVKEGESVESGKIIMIIE